MPYGHNGDVTSKNWTYFVVIADINDITVVNVSYPL